jgi:hypothetical protein
MGLGREELARVNPTFRQALLKVEPEQSVGHHLVILEADREGVAAEEVLDPLWFRPQPWQLDGKGVEVVETLARDPLRLLEGLQKVRGGFRVLLIDIRRTATVWMIGKILVRSK